MSEEMHTGNGKVYRLHEQDERISSAEKKIDDLLFQNALIISAHIPNIISEIKENRTETVAVSKTIKDLKTNVNIAGAFLAALFIFEALKLVITK